MAQSLPAESAPELWRGLTDSDTQEIASLLVCVFVAGMYRLLRGDWTKGVISALGVEKKWVNVIADLTAPPEALGDRYGVETRIVTWEEPDVLKIRGSGTFRAT